MVLARAQLSDRDWTLGYQLGPSLRRDSCPCLTSLAIVHSPWINVHHDIRGPHGRAVWDGSCFRLLDGMGMQVTELCLHDSELQTITCLMKLPVVLILTRITKIRVLVNDGRPGVGILPARGRWEH